MRQGDSRRAEEALADHFARRPRLRFAPELLLQAIDNAQSGGSYVRDEPQRVLRNEFAFLAEYVPFGRDFDWNGTFGRGDREITWWVNRFFWLRCLEDEYDRTRDTKYPRHGVAMIFDWIRKNPVSRAKDSWGSWRTLEIGLRLIEWSRFIDRFAAERVIRPDELIAILASLREQTEYLIAHSGPGRGNWGFMEQCGIGTVSLTFPEFRDADRWLAGAFEVCRIDTARQLYPDGSQEELTTHYGAVVVHTLARLLDLARQRGRTAPPELTEALRRAANYSILTLKPDLRLAMINDGDAIDLTPLFGYLARTLDLPEAKYALSRGNEGTAPPTCRLFPHSGLAVFRDSWRADARCLIFDAGPFGTGHQHEDALAVDVSAFGRSFIGDPGRYTYVNGPLRDYFIGTRSHATIMVDGSQQIRRKRPETWRGEQPLVARFAANDRLAMAVGHYTAGYDSPKAASVAHRRDVLFVNREYWVISDVLTGTGRHHIEQNFQFTPGTLRTRQDRVDSDGVASMRARLPQIDWGTIRFRQGIAVTGHDDANLAVLWVWPTAPRVEIHSGETNPHRGWYSPMYLRLEPAPLLTLSADIELPARITLVLFPFRGSVPPALRAAAIDDRGDLTRLCCIEFHANDRVEQIGIADMARPCTLSGDGGALRPFVAFVDSGEDRLLLPPPARPAR